MANSVCCFSSTKGDTYFKPMLQMYSMHITTAICHENWKNFLLNGYVTSETIYIRGIGEHWDISIYVSDFGHSNWIPINTSKTIVPGS